MHVSPLTPLSQAVRVPPGQCLASPRSSWGGPPESSPENSAALRILELDTASIDEAKADPTRVAEPDRSEDALWDLVNKMHAKKIKPSDVWEKSRKATAYMYNIQKIYSLGQTLPALQREVSRIVRLLAENRGSSPKGLLSWGGGEIIADGARRRCRILGR